MALGKILNDNVGVLSFSLEKSDTDGQIVFSFNQPFL